MEATVPWQRLMAVIEPHYRTRGKRGRPPIGIERMLRMYFVQQGYALADEAVEDPIYDRQALRDFCGSRWRRSRCPMRGPYFGFVIDWKPISCRKRCWVKSTRC